MPNKLYVGNLAFSVDETTLQNFFTEKGVKVEKAEVVRDVATGRPRGFGFVQLEAGQDSNVAIEVTNGKEIEGRALNVSLARERPRPSHGGGGGGRGRGSDRGGGPRGRGRR